MAMKVSLGRAIRRCSASAAHSWKTSADWSPQSRSTGCGNHLTCQLLATSRNGLQPGSDGIQRNSDGLQPSSDGLQPTSFLLLVKFGLNLDKFD